MEIIENGKLANQILNFCNYQINSYGIQLFEYLLT